MCKTIKKSEFKWLHPELHWDLTVTSSPYRGLNIEEVSFTFADRNTGLIYQDKFNVPLGQMHDSQKTSIALQCVAGLEGKPNLAPKLLPQLNQSILAGRIPLVLSIWRHNYKLSYSQVINGLAVADTNSGWDDWALPIIYGCVAKYNSKFSGNLPTKEAIAKAADQLVVGKIQEMTFILKDAENIAKIGEMVANMLLVEDCPNHATQTDKPDVVSAEGSIKEADNTQGTDKLENPDFVWSHHDLGWRIAIKTESLSKINIPAEHVSFSFSDTNSSFNTTGRYTWITLNESNKDADKVSAILQAMANPQLFRRIYPNVHSIEFDAKTEELSAWQPHNKDKVDNLIIGLLGGNQWKAWARPIILGEYEKHISIHGGTLPCRQAISLAANKVARGSIAFRHFTEEDTSSLIEMGKKIIEMAPPKQSMPAEKQDNTVKNPDFVWSHPDLGWRMALKTKVTNYGRNPVEQVSFDFCDTNSSFMVSGRMTSLIEFRGYLKDATKLEIILRTIIDLDILRKEYPGISSVRFYNKPPALSEWQKSNEKHVNNLIHRLHRGNQWKAWGRPIVLGELEKHLSTLGGALPTKEDISFTANKLVGGKIAFRHFTVEDTSSLIALAEEIAEVLKSKDEPKEEPVTTQSTDEPAAQAATTADLQRECDALKAQINLMREGMVVMAQTGGKACERIANNVLSQTPEQCLLMHDESVAINALESLKAEILSCANQNNSVSASCLLDASNPDQFETKTWLGVMAGKIDQEIEAVSSKTTYILNRKAITDEYQKTQ